MHGYNHFDQKEFYYFKINIKDIAIPTVTILIRRNGTKMHTVSPYNLISLEPSKHYSC